MSTLLTGNRRGGGESSSYILVQLDVHVLLLSDLLIPGLNLLLDPVGEGGAKDCGHNVANPLAADFVEFSFVRHVIWDIMWQTPAKRFDLLEG